ncbi:MAG TPA: hypothetical protein PLI62_12695, partial [Spirochaetota bacterium]|nr:hypothetical protein [Spirochaetota bacterium]
STSVVDFHYLVYAHAGRTGPGGRTASFTRNMQSISGTDTDSGNATHTMNRTYFTATASPITE